MRILITGGAGFIGRYFCELLRAGGTPINVLDLVTPDFDTGGARCTVGDVRDPAAVADAVQGCDRVLHLAAAHHDFGIDHDTYYDVNQNGSRVLCNAMDNAGITDCVFFSSVAVYGEAPEPHDEGAPTDPRHPYGGSKLAGEKVFHEWVSRGGGRRCLVIRPTITFGPRNFANMYSLIRQIDSGRFARVGKGDNVKSLSYVENIVQATMFLWEKRRSDPAAPAIDTFNFVEKPDLTSAQIADQIYSSLGKKPWPFAIPMWVALLGALPFDAVIKLTGKNLPVSSMRVKKLFETRTKFEADKLAAAGWKSPVSLNDGLDRMSKWYLAEGKRQPAVWRTPPARIGDAPGTTSMKGKRSAG
ncbi:MAG: NAD(P)-dependent oxidoreductase [Phycisphaerales bacterium]|nr:NAD(P)-dependent oxidoreductase [Phycisphaerales bacterium]